MTSAQNAEPLVSVIVPTFNRPERLQRAIKSILDQTYQNFEVIVVNDAGCDVEPLISSYRSVRVRYIFHETNKGLAAARNTALRVAEGSLIAYLDDDDIFYRDHLETLVQELGNSGFEVGYTDAVRANDASPGDRKETASSEIVESQDFDRELLLVANVAPVICFMHTRTAIEGVGLFDEELGPLEDWDLWIRMSRQRDFLHVRKATCEVRWTLDGSTMTSSQMAGFIQQRLRIFEKHKAFAQESPRAQIQQSKLCELMSRELPRKQNLQELINRTQASGISQEPIVRELIAHLVEFDKRLDTSEAALIDMEAKFNELVTLRDRVRQIPGFKAYHWLRHRSHA